MTTDIEQVQPSADFFTPRQQEWNNRGSVSASELKGESPKNPVFPAERRSGLPGWFPSNCFWGDDGRPWHTLWTMSEGGSYVLATRVLALNKTESIEGRLDYYDPVLGLIWDGYKLANDRSVTDRMNDRSATLARPGSRPLAG